MWVRCRPTLVEPRDTPFSVNVNVQFLRITIIRGKRLIGLPAGELLDPAGNLLKQGKPSRWLELSQTAKYGNYYCTVTFYATPETRAEGISKITLEIDFAWGPRESQIIKTLRESPDLGSVAGVTVPTERARGTETIVSSVWTSKFISTFRTFTELSRRRYERIKKLIPEPVPTSRYFNFCTGVRCPGGTYASSEIMRLELLSVSRMGINTLYASGQKWPRRLGIGHLFPDRCYSAGASPARYWVRRACPNHPDVPRRAEATMKLRAQRLIRQTEDPKAGSHIFGMKIGDEIGVAVGGSHIETCEDCQRGFKEFLKDEGFHPERFARSWGDVRWTPRECATDRFHRLLHYYSVLFLSANTAYIHRQLVESARRYYDPNIPIGYNVNPTPIMSGMGLDWFEMERHGGITAQWMEVIGAIQPGCSSFLADLAYGMVRRRNLKMGIYCLYVRPQRTARDTLAFATRGCCSFIYYNYGPRTLGAADNFSESDRAILAVAEATRPIVATEEFFVNTVRPKREVAILYSRTAEIWDEDNAVVRDRPYTYLALAHSQIPVDILSEWDVLDGKLSEYRILYLDGEHLRRDVAEKIRDWVKEGGWLWGDVGCAMFDEADNPLDALEPVFGVRQKLVERKYPVRFGYRLAETPDSELAKVIWSAPWAKGQTVCVLQRAFIEPLGAEIVARFDDGQPAGFINNFGRGRAFLLTYSARLTYSRFYRRRDRNPPLPFGKLDRDVIVQPALQTGVLRPVLLSKPGIEVQKLVSPRGTLISLIDLWLQDPTVTVRVELQHKPSTVKSFFSGQLAFKYTNGGLSFKLTLKNLDIVTIQ